MLVPEMEEIPQPPKKAQVPMPKQNTKETVEKKMSLKRVRK